MRRGRGRGRGGRCDQSEEYGEWGDYFSAKKAKLGVQLNTSTDDSSATDCPQIFAKISIYINGYTNPPEPELRTIFTKHGGEYTQYLTARTTFVIATNLPLAKKKFLAHKTLKPEWITDSIKAGIKLDPRSYFLYNLSEESKQKTLSQVMQKPIQSPQTSGLKFEKKSISWSSTRQSRSKANQDAASTSYHSDSELIGSSSETEGPEYVIDQESSPERDEPWKNKPIISTPTRTPSRDKSSESGMENADPSPVKITVAGGGTLRTTADEGFLDDFYKNSRLHLISTMKKETQYFVAGWRKDIATHKFPLLTEYEAMTSLNDLHESSSESQSIQPVILHIDLDCFFVAVGRLSRPHLIDMPVAVTHSKGTGTRDSKSDIACASYEARAKGVTAGMWVDEAKRLCPNIQTIPYDFEEYRRVSKIFFETVASLSLDIEAISCDELYLDATKVIEKFRGGSITSLATFLRKAIKESSKIDASIGIGNSKLSARIATRIAKESGTGQHIMSVSDLKEYVKTLPVEKLPGVGYATAEKLNEFYKIQNCQQLEKIPLQDLKTTFGMKNGEKLYWLCRGVDNDPVNCDRVLPKSLSAGCSFGVRFDSQQAMNKFIRDLANELSSRAKEAKCFGNKLTLSLWIVRKEFLDPVKPGGHGAADVHSRTRPFLLSTREPDVIYSAASELARSITQGCITPEYIRGVRISFDSLRYESEMSASERKTVQNTIASSFAAMKGKRAKPSPSPFNSSSIISPNKPKTSILSPSKSGILNYFKPKSSEAANGSTKSQGKQTSRDEDFWIEQNPGPLDQIDPSVWNALPSDIQAELEQANKIRRRKRSVDSISSGGSGSIMLDKPLGGNSPRRSSKLSFPSSTCSVRFENSVVDDQQPCSSRSFANRINQKSMITVTESVETLKEKIQEMSASVFDDKLASPDLIVEEPDTELVQFNEVKAVNIVDKVLDSDTEIRDSPGRAGADRSYQNDTFKTKTAGTDIRAKVIEIDAAILPTEPVSILRPILKIRKVENSIPLPNSAIDSRTSMPTTKKPVVVPSTSSISSNTYQVLQQVKLNKHFDGKGKEVPVASSAATSSSHSQMPSLNGVNTMREIKQMIRTGIQGREPTKGDTDILQSYLNELLHWQYLCETCELITFFWELLPQLKKEGSSNNLSWVNAFLLLISDTEKTILRKFGGVYYLPRLG